MRAKLKIYVAAFMFSILCLCPKPSGAIRQVHPPDMHPPPRPPEQALQKSYFYKWKSRDVTAALKAHGLEAEDSIPGVVIGAFAAKESAVFLTPSYGDNVGGMVSCYDSESKLNESLRYHSALNSNPESPGWRIFRKDNVLLFISVNVPEEKAREYEKALHNMK